MDIDVLLDYLRGYKAQGAKEVVLSGDTVNSPIRPLSLSYLPLSGNTTVYIYEPMILPPKPVIIEQKQLRQLSSTKPCEVCGCKMELHSWAALENSGSVVNCSIQQRAYERELIRTNRIKRRALEVSGEALKAYE